MQDKLVKEVCTLVSLLIEDFEDSGISAEITLRHVKHLVNEILQEKIVVKDGFVFKQQKQQYDEDK